MVKTKTIQNVSFVALALTLACGLLALPGCSIPSRGASTESQLVASNNGDNGRSQGSLPPALIALFDDKSESVKSARISPLREEDLIALFNRLRITGGELAFGLIGESSDRPLVRLRISPPPVKPGKPEVQNAFERAESDASFQIQEEKYQSEVRFWKEEVDRRVNAFLDVVRPRLQQRAADMRSPVNGALARAELFLNEPESVWARSPRRYIILNSDAVDTTKSAPVMIRSGTTLVLINGSGSLGVLKSQNPLRFESIQAALDFIAAEDIGSRQ